MVSLIFLLLMADSLSTEPRIFVYNFVPTHILIVWELIMSSHLRRNSLSNKKSHILSFRTLNIPNNCLGLPSLYCWTLSRVQLFATPWTTAHQASPSFTIPQSLLKLMSIDSVIPSNHLILCHPLLLLPSIFPSIRVFSNESALRIRWPKYWSFSFNISPSNEHTELISFWMNWLDLLAVPGSLRSLL